MWLLKVDATQPFRIQELIKKKIIIYYRYNRFTWKCATNSGNFQNEQII